MSQMQEQMETPKRHCDLVMKGGITSGVVYPRAIVELSRKYRFRNVGGTSAGAIAAVLAAAAEYGRETGGFARIDELPDELADTLLQKFQPAPKLRPLFNVLLASLSGSKRAVATSLATQYLAAAWFWAIPGIAVAGLWFWLDGSFAGLVLGALISIFGYLLGIGIALLRQITHDLPKADFGMCSGTTVPGHGGPALTDWLANLIDVVAGRDPLGPPLGVKDLADRNIVVRTVTTDITTRRPYALPMDNNLHFFSESEFRGLFPKRIVDFMLSNTAKVGPDEKDLHYFKLENLPVVLLVRMSLSFPGLISAVPLWRRDYTLDQLPEDEQYVRCLFSDGGLSSNFPVTFFDDILPQRPTFGISLGDLDARRGVGQVHLPFAAGKGIGLATKPIKGLRSFLAALVDSAKDWQDTLQSILPGYRERIVTVNLRDGEGGLNLQMPRETIEGLTELGSRAGAAIVEDFDLNEHRWRRYLVEVRAIDEMLRHFAASYRGAPEAGALSYPELAMLYEPKAYAGLSATQREVIKDRAEMIAALGESFGEKTALDGMKGNLPTSRSKLRIVGRMED